MSPVVLGIVLWLAIFLENGCFQESPADLKVLRSLKPSQRSLILRVYPGKDVWKAKGNRQGRRGVPLRWALWRTCREKEQPLQHLCYLEDDQGEKQGQRFLQTGKRRNAA